MTDQHSLEYIEYMQSDEAKALQRYVPVDMTGIWVVLTNDSGASGVHNLGDGKHKALNDLLGPNDSWLSWWWLPTLWQLLRIIEGAGVRCIIMAPSEPHPYWTVDAGLMEFNERDLLLAAAQLAVKVVSCQ